MKCQQIDQALDSIDGRIAEFENDYSADIVNNSFINAVETRYMKIKQAAVAVQFQTALRQVCFRLYVSKAGRQ